jgi:PAS domain S-box-containing protein
MTATRPLPESLAELVRNAGGALLVTGEDGSIIFVNDAAERLFGYQAEELLGEPVEMLMPEAQRERHTGLRQRYSGKPHSRPLVSGLELTGRRADGTRFRAEISLAPFHTDDGVVVASTIREVPENASSGDFFRALLESAPDALIIADSAGRIAIVNGRAEELFGYKRKDILGKPVEMLVPERLRNLHEAHRRGFQESPSMRMMGAGRNLAGRRRDGSEFVAEISLSPVEAGGERYVSTLIRDITERKRLEDELVEARREAERANRANSAFLAAASHDLRQPVQALSLLNGALRRAVKSPAALEMVDSQQQSLRAMTNLLNSLLDISRLDAGAIEPEIDRFPLQRLFDRLGAEFGRQAKQKGLDFEASPTAAIVESDPNLLGEIIQNFVSNALRYTDSGGVVLSATAGGQECRIEVVDSGSGIEPEQLEKIFEEFHQAPRDSGRNEGFGLGLAIVRRLADLLGHAVRVESTPGEGSLFSVTVPVVDAVRRAPGAGERVRDDETTTAGAGLIAIIEDDPAVSRALELLLSAEGFDVFVARSAKELRDQLDIFATCPSLIVSDYHVGDAVTGPELIADVRRHFSSSVPAFIISGDTSKIVDEASGVENSRIFAKPVDADQLLDALRAAVRSGRVADPV